MGIPVGSTVFGTVVLLCAALGSSPVSASTLQSPWINTEAPEFTYVKELPVGVLSPYSLNDRIDCETRDIATRPLLGGLSAVRHESCVVEAKFGSIATSGHIKVQGTGFYATPRYSEGTRMSVIAAPRASYAVSLEGGNYAGSYIVLTPSYGSSYEVRAAEQGEIELRLKPEVHRMKIVDERGNPIAFKYESISFSGGNARYIAADSAVHGTVRIDTETGEALVFATTINYFVGFGSAGTTVSGDGRYVLVANTAAEIRLYDLTTCGAESINQYGMKRCQSKDLRADMTKGIPGFAGATTFRFVDNHTISFWATIEKDGVKNRAQYVMSPAGIAPTSFQYLALGDSFASGEGAYHYKSNTDVKDNKCHVSVLSYPYLIADKLGMNTSESVACSGARIHDIVDILGRYNIDHAQSKNKHVDNFNDEIYDNFLTGYRIQKEFIFRKKPSVVTISAVGNDIGFGDIIKKCAMPGTCYKTYEDRYELMEQINSQFDRLTSMYGELRQTNDPRARLYVLGYPSIVKSGGDCAVNVKFNSTELRFANDLVAHLNDMIEAAAKKAGVFYVDVEDAFVGYRLCEDFHTLAVNGLTAGNDAPLGTFGPFGNESYHPSGFGHGLYRDVILQKTADLTAGMPEPDATSKPPKISPDSPLLAGMRKSNRGLNTVFYDHHLTADNLERTRQYELQTDGSYRLKPDSVYSAYLYSDPVFLGDTTTDAEGRLTGRITIPESVAPGFHTLHLFGRNIANEPIDIQKVVYVTGDTSTCFGFGSGQDVDRDGIDDGCDGQIGRAAPEPLPQPLPGPIEVSDPPPVFLPPVISLPIEELPPAKDGLPVETGPGRTFVPPELAVEVEEPPASAPAQATDEPTPQPVAQRQLQPAAPLQISEERLETTAAKPEVLGVSDAIPSPAIQATLAPDPLQRNTVGIQLLFYASGILLLGLTFGGFYKLAKADEQA